MGRYKAEKVNHGVAMDLADGIIETLSFGFAKAGTEVKITDTKTGETHSGWGDGTSSARKEAFSKFDKK